MILFLAGTSDARELAQKIKERGYQLFVTVVTENAAIELREAGLDVYVGRRTCSDFISIICEYRLRAIVDASHPFAEEASINALLAAKEAGIPYIRYERESQSYSSKGITIAKDYVEAAEIALQKKGVILLTTGSKTLQIFTEKLLKKPNIRLIVRMLPQKENLEKCEELSFPQKDIVAIQGPFTKEFNIAMYKQFGVTTMITKESGKVGSVNEKVEAALELGIDTIIIKRPLINYENQYSSFSNVITYLDNTLNGGSENGFSDRL